MNADFLFKYFERIAEAPDSVFRLRRFILELAVRGELVPQDSKDESVLLLIDEIKNQRKRLAKIGELITSQTLIEAPGAIFPVPSSWKLVRLGFVQNVVMGQSPPGETYNTDRQGVPLINGPVEFSKGPFGTTLLNQYTTAPTKRCKKGDLLLCVRGSTTGRTNVAGFDACIGRGVAALQPLYADEFVRLFIWWSRDRIIEMGRGIAFPSISRKQIEDLPTPLPPLAEQHRIVAKVDELMAICDELEAAQVKREKRRDRLVASALHGMNNGENGEDFRESARFYFDHLPRLTTRPEHIRQLRQTILNLAVRGRLVPQDPNDEPAKALVDLIRQRKGQLFPANTLKKQEPSICVLQSEHVFDIPSNWQWARINDLAISVNYGTSQKSENMSEGVPVLKMGDIQGGRVFLGSQQKVRKDIDDLPALLLNKFDLLYNRTNSAELVGKTGIYLGEDDEFTFASYLIRIRFALDFTEPHYVNLAMNASYFRETQVVPHLKQQCGQANVNGTKLKNMIIPLPPLAEQRRIVAKVDELMTLCDQLESHIYASSSTRGKLLEASLYEALNGRT